MSERVGKQCVLVLILLLAGWGVAVGQDKPATLKTPASAPPLLFRRELLPQTLLAREAKGLVPIKRSEFEALLAAVQARDSQGAPAAWIEAAEFTARLIDTQLVGTATLQIRSRSPDATLLALTGLKLPVVDPHWKAEPARPAIVGAAVDGPLRVVVEGDGVLTFSWSLTGRRDPWQSVLFDLPLPDTGINNVLIALPAEGRLQASSGVVTRRDDQWQILLGGAGETRLRCSPPSEATGPVVLAREENSYVVSQAEIDIQCQLRLDVYREQVQHLEVELLGGWSASAIRQGDTPVPYEVIDRDGRKFLELQFDPPLAGTNRRLAITGRAALQDGAATLVPRARVVDAAWLDGRATIEAGQLQLTQWQLNGVQRSANVAANQEQGKTTWDFLDEDATISFIASPPATNLHAQFGSLVRVDADSVTSRVVTDFTAELPGVFELIAEVATGWVVDSIETVPSQVVEDWDLTTPDQKLRIALNRSVAPGQDLRVIVHAHRASPVAKETLSGDQLRPLRWEAEQVKGYVAAGMDAGWQLDTLADDRLQRIDEARLTPAELDRLRPLDDAIILAESEGLEGARLRFAEESPQFTADWHLRIADEGDQIQQLAELRIEPAATPVDRFRVLVRPSAGKDMSWQLEGEDSAALEARLVRTTPGPAGEDEWEFALRRARRTAFTLRGTSFTKETNRFSVKLFRCVEATAQSALVELSHSDSSRFIVEHAAGLQRLWNEADIEGAAARWSYDPSQAASLVVRAASASEIRQLLLVREMTLETRYAQQHLMHAAEIVVDNAQAQTFSVRLPSASELDHVLVDDRRREIRTASAGQVVLIPLAAADTSQTVRVVYRSIPAPHHALLSLTPQWPECEVEIMSRRWRVVVPKLYRELSFAKSTETSWPLSLLRRMTGPLPGFGEPIGDDPITEEESFLAYRVLNYGPDAIPAELHFIHANALAGLSWAALVLCWTLLAMCRRSQPRQLLGLTLLLGIVALSLPAVLDPIGRMMVLGTFVGLASITWIDVRTTLPQPPAESLRAAMSAAGIVLLVATALPIAAQPPSPAVTAVGEKEVIHRVVFPVDAAGKPSGDYVYASNRFFQGLFARAQAPTEQGPDFLLTSAEYLAQPSSDALSWASISAAIELDVLEVPATVQIPWTREGFVIPPDRFRLDGRPIKCVWNDDGSSLSFLVETGGRHTFEFAATPAVPAGGAAERCLLRLPRVANAQLVLNSLGGTAKLQCLADAPLLTAISDEGQQTLALENIQQVTLVTRPNDSAAPVVSAEQLLWASLWPSGSVVEGRWRFTSTEGKMASVAIEVGDGLELISSAAFTSASALLTTDAGQRVLVWTPREPAEEILVEALFLWRDAKQVERVLPRVEPRAAVVSRRWLAIDSVPSAPAVMPPVRVADVVEPQAFADFLGAEESPQSVRQIPQPGPVPLPTSTNDSLQYSGNTHCEIGLKSTSWRFQATIEQLKTPRTMLRVVVPAGSRIRSAELGVAGQLRSLPWLLLAGNEIGLLLPEPLRQGNTLVLQGELPAGEPTQVFILPAIQAGTASSHMVELTSPSDVQATVLSSQGLIASTTSSPNELAPVASERYQLDKDQTGNVVPQLAWSVRVNRPRTVGILITTLRYEQSQWVARLDAFLAIRDGNVTSFRFESPANWSPTQLVEGSGSLLIDGEPNSGRFSIRPTDAAARYHFACEGPLAVNASRQLKVPTIRLLDAEAIQQFVRLPRGADLNWSTSGVQDAALPPAVPLANEITLATYRVAVPQFRVELLEDQPVERLPRAAWGNVLIAPRGKGQFLATASLAVDPLGEAMLPIMLPGDAQVVRVDVQGEPQIVNLQGNRQLLVPLRSSTLPQLVNVSYHGEADDLQTRDLKSLAPSIAPWNMSRAWSVLLADERTAGGDGFSTELESLLRPALDSRSLEPPPADWAASWLALISFRSMATDANTPLIDELQQYAADRIDSTRSSLPLITESPEVPRGVATASWFGWLLGLIVWVGMVLAGNQLGRSAIGRDLARRWPSWMAVLTGLAVALLVSPVWIGAILMIVGAASSLAWPWRTIAPR